MIKSMDSAVSAIRAQQTKLDVTANNIANVNTVGFKKSRTVFSTLLNSTVRSASGPNNIRGGINPSTVGMGVQVSSIDTVHTQGIISSTGRALDLAMQGDGFFVVSDGVNDYYTRNGAFTLSPLDGSVTLFDGMRLQGYPIDEQTGLVDKSNGLQNIAVPAGSEVISIVTSQVDFAGNISSKSPVGTVVSVPFSAYDSLGTKQMFNIKLTTTANGATWEITHNDGLPVGGGTGTIVFDTEGKIDLGKSTTGPITLTPVGAEPMSIDINFDKVTRVDKESDFSMRSQNGMPVGTVQSVGITNGGYVTVSYSNGMTKDVGAIGIALFDNPGGLLAYEDSMYKVTANSGNPLMVAGAESTRANVVSGYLEGSNVDVSEELTDMIKTQRAYQMATKIVTTSDEMLQELTNIKR